MKNKVRVKGSFDEQIKQLELLKSCGLSINMNDGWFYFENINQAIEIMKLFIKYKVPGYQYYIPDLRSLSATQYNNKQNVIAYDEKYILNKEVDCVQIENSARKINIELLNIDDIKSYKFSFFDGGEDLELSNNRVILYKIGQNSEVFKTFYDFINLNQSAIYDLYDKNKSIRFKCVDDFIWIIYNKVLSKNNGDNSIIITKDNIDNFESLENLYEILSSNVKKR